MQSQKNNNQALKTTSLSSSGGEACKRASFASRRRSTLDSMSADCDRAKDLVFRGLVGRTIASFSVTDPKYQKSEQFRPDQFDGWEERFPGDHIKHSLAALANEAHLKEMCDMLRVLESLEEQGRPLESWQVRSIQSWYRAHYLWTSRRFQVNRSYIIPLWERRFHYPRIIKDAQDHFEKDLHGIASIVDALKEGDLVHKVGLVEAWRIYAMHLEVAMTAFTDIGMMLYHAYFSYEENLELVKGLDVVTKVSQFTQALGAAIYACGGVEKFNAICIKGEGAHLAMEGFFRQRYQDYLKSVAIHMKALEKGDPSSLEGDACINNKISVVSSSVVPFNPLDPKYQKDEQFAPDKLDEWIERSPLHVEESAFVMANEAHRAEIGDMKEVLEKIAARGKAAPEWVVDSIKGWWACHSEWTWSRLQVLQEYTLPIYETRFFFPATLIESLVRIRHLIHDVDDVMLELKSGDDVWRMYDLLDCWSEYKVETAKCLDLTEPMATMLFHAYFTREEARNINRMELERMSNLCVGSIIHYLGKERVADTLQINSFQLNFKLREYNRASTVHLRALQLGLGPRTTCRDSGQEMNIGRNYSIIGLCTMLRDNLKDERVQSKSKERQCNKSSSVRKMTFLL